MDKPKILIFGNNNLAVECLRFLILSGEDVFAVIPDPGDHGKDGWQKSLRKEAQRLKVKILNTDNINEPSFVASIKNKGIDYIFSFQCRQIMKNDLITAPKRRCINLHFSLLPKYRGCYPIAWAIHNGESECGVTLHYINGGIDKGDIIANKKIAIRDNFTAREVYDLCNFYGIKLFKEYYPHLASGNVESTAQQDKNASYYPTGSFNFEDKLVDWNKDARQLSNWIRALIFPPLQLPFFLKGKDAVEILKAQLAKGVEAKGIPPATIVSISEEGVVVMASNGAVMINRVKVGSRVLNGLEFAGLYGLKVDDKVDV